MVLAGMLVLSAGFPQCSQGSGSPEGPPPAVAEVALPSQPAAPTASNDIFISVARAAKASVVNISSTRKMRQESQPFNPFFDDPFFRRFFGEEFERRFEPQPKERREQGLGSGVIVSPDGYIVTSKRKRSGRIRRRTWR
jgi:serine protease Do